MLAAAFIVKSLPLTALRWLVVVVVLYTSFTMLRSALRDAATGRGAHLPAPPADGLSGSG